MSFCSAQLLSKSKRGFVNQALFGIRKEEFRKEKEGVRLLALKVGWVSLHIMHLKLQ